MLLLHHQSKGILCDSNLHGHRHNFMKSPTIHSYIHSFSHSFISMYVQKITVNLINTFTESVSIIHAIGVKSH